MFLCLNFISCDIFSPLIANSNNQIYFDSRRLRPSERNFVCCELRLASCPEFEKGIPLLKFYMFSTLPKTLKIVPIGCVPQPFASEIRRSNPQNQNPYNSYIMLHGFNPHGYQISLRYVKKSVRGAVRGKSKQCICVE